MKKLFAFVSILLATSCRCCSQDCYCDDNEMTCEYFTEHSLSKLDIPKEITKLQITASVLKTITKESLKNLKHLNELEMIDCSIEHIEEKAFQEMRQLVKLNLNRNKLSSLRANMFFGLFNLKYFELNRNNISELPAGIFNQLLNIVELRIMYNQLKAIPNNVFTRLPSLRLLFLSYNNIERIGDQAFQNLTFNLLSLAKNSITRLPTSAFNGFRISSSIMLLSNPFDCSCNQSMRYAVELRHLARKITAFCATPYNAARKNILEAHEDLFCTQCDLSLCRNNAKCVGDKTSYKCVCEERFKGRFCETNVCSRQTTSPPPAIFNTISPGSKTIRINDVQYIPLKDVKVRHVKEETNEREIILYAICASEFVIILFFVCFYIYKRYIEWKEEKRFNTEVGRDILKRVRYESNQKIAEALNNDPAPIHIKNMILNGSVAV